MTTAADWARCRPLIEAALAHSPGVEDIEDVERFVQDGSYQFWAGTNCAAITQISDYAQKKVLTIVHGGGDKGELIERLEPAICAFAQHEGCDTIFITGREGWKREGEKRGYRLAWVTMMKELKQ